MIVVADASPLIALAQIGHLQLLRDLYESVTIPEAVRDEISSSPDFGRSLPPWMLVRAPADPVLATRLLDDLDPGEAEAVALAVELEALLLIDELAGRGVAQQLGLTVTGTLGVLAQAKREGLVQQLAPLVMDLRSVEFWMSEALVARFLREMGETEPDR